MKCQDIHKNLNKQEMRDFIGKIYFNKTGEYYIKYLESQILELTENLKKARITMGIQQLCDELKWKGFDISDEIENYNKENYFSFIGTEKEYQSLIKKINNETLPQT